MDKEQALRYNKGKKEWSLVDFKSLEPLVEVLSFGAEKYDKHNWKKGLPVTEIMESMMRHTFALNSGEDLDPESGLPHIGHIMCNAMFISHFLETKWDDREKESISITDVVLELNEEIKNGK